MSSEFNPNEPSVPNGNYFALPYTLEESALVLLSVPWDVTTSYRAGASQGPDAMIDASAQMDLYDYHHPYGYRRGIGTVPIEESIMETNQLLRKDAEKIMGHLANGGSVTDEVIRRRLSRINAASEELNGYVYGQSREWLSKGKTVGLVGGDHSTPLGLIKAVAEKHGSIGILHIDAHADLRKAYEGFTHSHASIMYNVMGQIPQVTSLVQVGLRDYCEEEVDLQRNDPRITVFPDYRLKEDRFAGKRYVEQCREIIAGLPEKVYVSFDIDGLSPDNCPDTGTPVPGGLSFHEAVFLLKTLTDSGRTIVGFDLTEVSPESNGEWNANVGARMLFKLCNFTLLSNPPQ